MMEGITPQERLKIKQLMYRLGIQEVPADTNVMAWVLPTLQVVVEKFEGLHRRIAELEHLMRETSKRELSK